MSDAAAWDLRYADGDFQFGDRPNEYLRSQAWRWSPGQRALAAGDGEGRNGVWLAEQGLEVTALDWSAAGMAKARVLAARRGVAMQTIIADVTQWDWPEARFDLIAWIYVHLPPADRVTATRGLLRSLAPGGLLVLECFSPAQEGRPSGGPKDVSLLWNRAAVEQAFGILEVLELLEGTVRLDEGPKHQGPAEVVRAVLRRT